MNLEKLIPQRPPFRFIDIIDELEPGVRAVARRKLREEELYFPAHFPDNPVFPGVLMIEAAGQLANAIIRSLPDYENSYLYYSKMSRVKFNEEAIPGDELVIEVNVTDKIDNLLFCKATVQKNSREAFRAEIVFAIVKE